MKKRVPIVHQVHELTDPVPMKSRVAFKRPLSAHERVQRALRTHEQLRRLEAEPGDESFDDPPYEDLTPHQLIVDPVSGEEMTAGEHVMLQEERAKARIDVEAERQRQFAAKNSKKIKKGASHQDEEDDKSDD